MDAKSRFLRAGILFPLVLIAVTTIYLAAAFDIRSPFAAPGEISPNGIPILTAVLMYVALLVVLVQEIRSPPDLPDESDDGSLLRPALVVVATGAYILLFRPLGYSLSTLLFVAALFVTFGFETRRPLRFALYAVGVTAVFYGLFALVFGVRLPTFPGIEF
ncbi:Tripartite tricarboxylate transporter TctB family protein [Palleronia marisminoris]|uniref:Tripartite tricarboxylate transporter TctB family protein n=1 Tax=Palleronia marisminoris TaxID=315423 RepID=A0A1Y5S1R5_9RHOB|nr:tripartite tricarboxylate transporter TctB family protein [Palleronia marisminoris]SFG38763.1 Tripartite tricarboxylate transporter TctB family protein [Palleronia marisminoris]SLN29646.1 Tripartite tricarboxylate transporter TctB family protein [Palleronia marisminoris]